jgi:hypothetical protein
VLKRYITNFPILSFSLFFFFNNLDFQLEVDTSREKRSADRENKIRRPTKEVVLNLFRAFTVG